MGIKDQSLVCGIRESMCVSKNIKHELIMEEGEK